MTEKNDNKLTKVTYAIIALFAIVPFGLLGAFIGFSDENSSALSGFLWGVGIVIVTSVVIGVGMLGWDWVKKEANEDKLRPYLACGFIAAIAISAWFAWGVGEPSCLEYEPDTGRGSYCLEYADDGFEVTTEQRWEEFWNKLPITLMISTLIAVIVRNEMQKHQK